MPGHPAPRPRRAASEASGHWAVAIGQDNLGTIQTGDHATAVTLPYEALRPAAEVDAPPGLDDLRHRPHRFVGRAVELDRLDAALTPPGGAVVQAVHGLGGVGKSALASHWAATRAHGCFPIRWINADSQANVQQGLADLATALQPALARVLSVELLAERALQWLATHTGWLLILDNVEDPADIAPLTDGLTTGRLLITSRLATTWNHVTTVIRLDVLDPAESLELLTRILTADGPRGPDGSAELCAEVGHFPLAIEQAASYLVENRLTTPTPRAYLDLLARYPADMYRDAGVTTGAERTIARVWRLTLDRITTAHPLAGDLLRTLAWYAPDHIPMTLLDGFGPPPALNRALGLLTAYSMVTPAPDTGGLSVHRLVQAFARTPDPDDPHRTGEAVDRAREHAVGRLAAAFPGDGNDPVTWPAWRGLLPHIDTLLDHGAETSDTLATAGLLNGAGVFLLGQGLCTRALEPLRRALAGTERLLGADHPNTLTARNNLAAAYESAGDLDRAVSLHTGNLTRRARVLGVSHPSTLISRNNLAGAYEAAGRVDEAIVLYEGNLADLAQVLGPAHPHTLAAKNNLAGAYETAGDLNRAVVLYEQNLEDCARALGSDHPDTLMYRNNLSGAYKSGGDPGRAIPLFERNLDDQIRVLGSDHADVLSSRNNLATAYAAVGDLDRAVPLLVRNLADRTRILGADHPAALTSRHNLARAYQDGGDLDRALPLLERNLDDRVRLLGPDHPDTLTSRDSLAGALQDGGDLDRALPLLERNLDDRVRLLGPDHPDTLTSRDSLARAFQDGGDLDRALPLLERNLDDRIRLQGRGHPDTLIARNNLADACRHAGDVRRAVPLFARNLRDCTRMLGPDHPHTLAARNNLADVHKAAGNPARALSLHAENLAEGMRVLGADHPQVLGSRNNLAQAHRAVGDLARALPLFTRNLTDCERVFSLDHPKTLTARNNLAEAYAEAGDPGRAAALYRQSLASMRRTLGHTHPWTAAVRTALVRTLAASAGEG